MGRSIISERVDDVRDYILDVYYQFAPSPGGGRPPGPLPLAVAEPAILIERAVEVSGPDGISAQELRMIFGLVDTDRYERGLTLARGAGAINNTWEKRPGLTGAPDWQVIFRPMSS